MSFARIANYPSYSKIRWLTEGFLAACLSGLYYGVDSRKYTDYAIENNANNASLEEKNPRLRQISSCITQAFIDSGFKHPIYFDYSNLKIPNLVTVSKSVKNDIFLNKNNYYLVGQPKFRYFFSPDQPLFVNSKVNAVNAYWRLYHLDEDNKLNKSYLTFTKNGQPYIGHMQPNLLTLTKQVMLYDANRGPIDAAVVSSWLNKDKSAVVLVYGKTLTLPLPQIYAIGGHEAQHALQSHLDLRNISFGLICYLNARALEFAIRYGIKNNSLNGLSAVGVSALMYWLGTPAINRITEKRADVVGAQKLGTADDLSDCFRENLDPFTESFLEEKFSSHPAGNKRVNYLSKVKSTSNGSKFFQSACLEKLLKEEYERFGEDHTTAKISAIKP